MDFIEIFRAIRTHWVACLATWFVVVLISVVVALVKTPVYRSEVSVVPVPDDAASASLAGLSGQFGGLASLAGINLPKGGNWDEAVATLRSRHLVEQLVTTKALLPVLYPDRWDSTRNDWRIGAKVPTMGDAVLTFRNRILQIREDAKTGIVTVRVDWKDARAAASWANELVRIADDELRARAIANADASLAALRQELSKSQEVELRVAIARLIEAQIKSKMIAGLRREYAFRVIDVAVPADSDKRVQPTRTVMVVAGGVLGGLMALAVALMLQAWRGRLRQPA
jgi:uncharacterized protein involved in exopolysaccharide biosynthesis